ncbi:hypothetical protein [Kibdelosporangium philippinense]|uniref:hypothetical protein n=1 Tax=Kibdelosporangium philippinense TaxID=211113 RepID=UPI00361CB2CE
MPVDSRAGPGIHRAGVVASGCRTSDFIGPERHFGVPEWWTRDVCSHLGVLERASRCAGTVDTLCRNAHLKVLERASRCAATVDTLCRNAHLKVLERASRCVGVVDTPSRNGGHTVQERAFHAAGTVDTLCRNGGHAWGGGSARFGSVLCGQFSFDVFPWAQDGWADRFVQVAADPAAGVAASYVPSARGSAPMATRFFDQYPVVGTVAVALAQFALQPAEFRLPVVDPEFVLAGHTLTAVVHPLAG